jgi:hypothetical protein
MLLVFLLIGKNRGRTIFIIRRLAKRRGDDCIFFRGRKCRLIVQKIAHITWVSRCSLHFIATHPTVACKLFCTTKLTAQHLL